MTRRRVGSPWVAGWRRAARETAKVSPRMIVKARRIILATLIAAIAGCVSRSHGTMIGSPPSPTTAKTIAFHPILYHRVGGIAGTDDRVVIWPDGVVEVTGKMLPSAITRLDQVRLTHLINMFRGWSHLHDEYLADLADAYSITISYGDKSVTAMDLASDL